MKVTAFLLGAVLASAPLSAFAQDNSQKEVKGFSTTVTGRVEAYEPGKWITIRDVNGKALRYLINDTTAIPADVAVGKTVTVKITDPRTPAYARDVTVVNETSPTTATPASPKPY